MVAWCHTFSLELLDLFPEGYECGLRAEGVEVSTSEVGRALGCHQAKINIIRHVESFAGKVRDQ